MDDAERAEQHEQMFRDIALAQVKPVLKPAGHCYYCDETVRRGVLFCGSDCAADWEHESKLRHIMGASKGRA